MRELDDLLLGYLERHFDAAADEEKQAFHALLDLPDPVLAAILLNRQQPAGDLQRVVAKILERT